MNAFNHFITLAENTLNAINRLVTGNGDAANFMNTLIGYTNEIKSRNTVYSGSRIGMHAEELSKSDPWQAVRLIDSYCRRPMPGQATGELNKWIAAGALGQIIEAGLNESTPNIDKMMEEFSGRWERTFSSIQDQQRANVEAQSSTSATFAEELGAAHSNLATLKSQNEKAIIDGAAQIDAFRKTYNAELALRAPTTYWSAKQRGHWKVAALWSLGFLVLAALAACLIGHVWGLTAAPYFVPVLPGKAPLPVPSYGALLPAVAAAFISVWVLRIVSRQLLVHFTLASDAGERVAMVQTFLALMQIPEHVREEDRILILSSLFRPSTRSDDDATPPNWFDLIMQRIKPH